MTKFEMICPHCGSANVHKDAAAAWCAETQTWELSSIHDSETCNDCGSDGDFMAERRVIKKPIDRIIDALEDCQTRLELNDCEGEEQAYIEQISQALIDANALRGEA